MFCCNCCWFQKLINAIKSIKCDPSISIPQPLEISGNMACTGDLNVKEPLEVSGTVTSVLLVDNPIPISGDFNCETTVSVEIPQPLEISGEVACTSTDACLSEFIDALNNTITYNEIVFKNGEQYQNVKNVSISGSLIRFNSQNQSVIAPICNIEYVVEN